MTTQALQAVVPVALTEVMAHLLPRFTAQTGIEVTTASMLNPEVPGHIAGGARFDLALSNPPYLEQVIASGAGDARSHLPFGRASLAFAAQGADGGPVATTREAIAKVLQGTETIALTDAGTSGAMLHRLADALGIGAALAPKLRALPGGEPIRALLAGEVDLAALPLTNIAPVADVHVVARCPFDWGVHIDLSLVCPPGDGPGPVLADWLLDPARDTDLSAMGAERFTFDAKAPLTPADQA